MFGIKELDLLDTNQQRGLTDSIQTTSGIAQIFQNPVKNKKGANVKKTGFVLYWGIEDLIINSGPCVCRVSFILWNPDYFI